jgi:flagellar motor switch protein FliG
MDKFSQRAAAYRKVQDPKGGKKKGAQNDGGGLEGSGRDGGGRDGGGPSEQEKQAFEEHASAELDAVRQLLNRQGTQNRSPGNAGASRGRESANRGGSGSAGASPAPGSGRAGTPGARGGGEGTGARGGGEGTGARAGTGRGTAAQRVQGAGGTENGGTQSGGDTGSDASEQRGRVQKAARFLVLLGKEQAAQVLQHLDDAEIEELVGEIARIQRIEREEAEELLSEFQGFIKTGAGAHRGGPETARRMLAEAFGTERAEELYEQAEKKHSGPFDFLNNLEDGQLRTLLRAESTAVQALVITMIEPQKAAELLRALPDEQKPQLVARIGRMQKVDRTVLARIAEALREKVRTQGRVVEEEVQGKGVLSQILRKMKVQEGRDLLAGIAERDPELAEQMRKELFTVETVLDIEDRGLQEVLADMDDQEVALVLKGKEERFRAKILENVSGNRRRAISDAYAHMGAMSRSEVDRASGDFLEHLRQLEEQGRLVVRSEDEAYI